MVTSKPPQGEEENTASCGPLPEKYPDGHAIKTKIEDLVSMMPYIPMEQWYFYEALEGRVTAENVSDDECGQ